jgi:hypothetical protein
MAEKIYRCKSCGLIYEEKEWAEKCEAFCRKHNACDMDIIKHALSENQKEAMED